jgi:DNA-binding response OmpR family regulator
MEATNKRILIVEDNDGLRILTNKILETAKYEVVEARNGVEAIKILSMYDDIGLILLDIMMPRMNGVEFLEKIQELKADQGFKVCMLSAKEQDKDVKSCLVKGADDYIIKPMDRDLLLEKVKILLDNIGNYKFASIVAKLSGKVLRLESSIDVKIVAISENEIKFLTPLEIPCGAKVQLDSEKLNLVLGKNRPLLLRVYKSESERNGKGFVSRGSFIGLTEETYKRIRSITTRGEDLDE